MEETTVDPKVPQTSVSEEKPDWFVGTLTKSIPPTLTELYGTGASPSSFQLTEPENYWSKQSIRDSFKDPATGQERKDLFDQAYAESSKQFKAYRDAELNLQNYVEQTPTAAARRNGKATLKPIVYEVNPDIQGRSYQSGYGFSEAQKSTMQAAIEQGTLMSDGSYIHPGDFGGESKLALDDKGTLLLNDKGQPYLKPVEKGEQLHSWDNIYSQLTDKVGRYGHDYDASIPHLLESIPKNLINFLANSVDDLIEYPRGIMNGLGIDTPSSDKLLNRAENFAKSYKQTSAETTGDKFISVEGVQDMSQQVVYQLAAMGGIGAVVTGLTHNPKAGSAAAMLFMSMLSAGSAQESARDNGLSKKEAALHMALLTGALLPISALSEVALGRLGGKESVAGLRKTISDATENGILIKKAAAPGASEALKKSVAMRVKDAATAWLKQVPENMHSGAFKALDASPLVTSAASEAAEEVLEQIADELNRGAFNTFGDQKHNFKFDLNTELKALGQSAIGGAIGGPVAHAMFSRMIDSHPGVAHNMADMIADGKADVLRNFADKMFKAGRLDHNWMTSQGTITDPKAGNSRNDEAYNTLTGLINYLDETYKASGLPKLKEQNEVAARTMFADTLKMSSVGKDASALNTSLIKMNADLNEAKAAATPNPDLINTLNNKIQLTQQSLAKIIKGDFVNDYVTEGLYNLRGMMTGDPETAQNKLSGKEFMALTNQLPDLHAHATEEHKIIAAAQDSSDASATVENPAGASQKRLSELTTENKTAYDASVEALTPHAEDINSVVNADGDTDLIPENLASDNENILESELNVADSVVPRLKTDAAKTALTETIKHGRSKLGLLKHAAALKKNPVEQLAPVPSDALMRMTLGTGTLIESSPSTIHQKIEEELEEKQNKTINGISTYSNSPKLRDIKNSIEQRIAQVKSLLMLNAEIKTSRELHKKPSLPDMSEQELTGAYMSLRNLNGLVNSLIDESDSNAASADLRIAQATAGLLNKTAGYLDKFAEAVIGTEFASIQEIIDGSRETLYDAISKADITGAQKILNQTESKIYEQFRDKTQAITDILSKQEYNDVSVRTYDYVRGILSLSSTDFWNAFQSVLSNSNSTAHSPSDEHAIVIKQTVQGLFADEYNPPVRTSSQGLTHIQEVRHHSAVFTEGRGRTGKSSTLVPMISGIVQTLTGGEVFLTAAKDATDAKRTGLIASVQNFFQISDIASGIRLKNSAENILDFMNSGKLVDGVNLIVYDEATLLTSKELKAIQTKLNEINNKRKNDPAKPSLLKLVLTGDTLQNSVGMERNNPDARALGIDDVNRHVIQRTPSLAFSFSQTNQQLTLFSSYLEDIQKEQGISRAFNTEFSNREGAQILNSYEDFISNAAAYINTLSKNNRLGDAIYITDKGPHELDSRILASGIAIMPSELAQGREWPIVFFDPKNDSLFDTKLTNLGVKKDYYTASTRASHYLLAHVAQGQGITSTEGSVNKVRPLSPENASRENSLKKVSEILGTLSAEVKPVSFPTPAVRIVKEDQLFSSSLTETLPAAGDTQPDEEVASQTPSAVKQSVIEYLTSINRKDLTSLFTFFTDELRDFDQQMELKRKALFNKDARTQIPYRLSIERIGSPGYENVLRNDPSFKGQYAVFIEAGPEANHVVLGTLSSPGLDEHIRTTNMLQGKESVKIPLNPSFLNESESFAPTTIPSKTHEVITLGEVRKRSKGIYFGSPLVLTISNPKVNSGGTESVAPAGSVVMPVSFLRKRQDIDRSMKRSNTDDYISQVGLRSAFLATNDIYHELKRYVDEEGNFDYTADNGLSGQMYDAMWGHLTNIGVLSDGTIRQSPFSLAMREVRDKLGPSHPDVSFVNKYIEPEKVSGSKKEIETIISKIDAAEGNSEVTVRSKRDGNYFMANYLRAKKTGNKKNIELYENIFKALRETRQFSKGFQFNPRVEQKSTDKTVTAHAKVRPLTDEIYDKYMVAEMDYISPPILRIPMKSILKAISDAVPARTVSGAVLDIKAGKTSGTPEEQVFHSENSKEIEEALKVELAHKGQSENEYAEPSQSASVASPSDEITNITDDAYIPQVVDEEAPAAPDGSPSLQNFQKLWFSKPGYSSMFLDTIRSFRRDFMNSMFSLSGESGAQPFLRDLDTVVKDLTKGNSDLAKYTPEFISQLDPVRLADDRDLYMKIVKAKEQQFLIKKYFPAVVLNKENKKHEFTSTHRKQKSWAEKETFDLIADGMTDMVKSQLYNTPVIKEVNGQWVATEGFVWEGDIENLIDSLSSVTHFSVADIGEALRLSPNDAAKSVYQRFFAPEPYILDGKTTWAIGEIQNPDTLHMTNAVAQFMLSGGIFDLTKVDLDEQRLRVAWSPWGSPNTVREISVQSVSQVAVREGRGIIEDADGSMIMGPLTVYPSAVSLPDNTRTLDAIHAIGLTSFTEQNLKTLQESHFGQFNIDKNSTNIPQIVNNSVVDKLIIPTMRKMKNGNFLPFRNLNILYDRIVQSSSSSNILMDTTVEKTKSPRLRQSAPIYRINAQLERIRAEESSVLTGSLLVNGKMRIEKAPVKDGFETWKNGTSLNSVSMGEVADFDIVWSFAQMLKDQHKNTGAFNTAMMTPLVWSDSATDPQFIVTVDGGYFRDPKVIGSDLFASRKDYYNRLSGQILGTWNDFFRSKGIDFRPSTLMGLKSRLNAEPSVSEGVESFPGMINQLYYVKGEKGNTIKDSLVNDVAFYSGDNEKAFHSRLADNFIKFREFSDSNKDAKKESMTSRLGKVIDGKSGEDVLKAFYYNWVAFSTDFSNVMVGASQQYKEGKDGEGTHNEYIDGVKRYKLIMANRTAMVYRNKSWSDQARVVRESGQPMTQKMRHEGKKLPQDMKVAYVKDIELALTLPSKSKKNQEIYDGATFVSPLTRIFQRYSNSGNHGTYVGSVMKNLTYNEDTKGGVATYVKNAEFNITPELLRKGTPRLINLAKRMLSGRFSSPVQGEKGIVGSPYEHMIHHLGVAEDFSNIEWKHFEQLADWLVEGGLQDDVIWEVIPKSAQKSGGGAINEFDAETPFVTEKRNHINKGTQLDASHGIDEIKRVSASQLINAMAVTWPKDITSGRGKVHHETLMRLYNSLAYAANMEVAKWGKLSPEETVKALKKMIQESFAKRPDMSYATQVTSAANGYNFSIDDRQLMSPMITQLTSNLTKDAVLMEYAGGQYIVHPTSGLFQVYDVERDTETEVNGNNVAGLQKLTVFKDELTPDEKTRIEQGHLKGRDLKYNMSDGYAEIVLPASMRNDFGIEPGTLFNDITPEYFYKLMGKKADMRLARRKHSDFVRVMHQIVTRIPSTGPHSGMAARIIGFMEESENAIFAPPEMLFVQGADQDVDKGTNFTYETVRGLVPAVDENYTLLSPELFKGKEKEAQLAGVRNEVVKSMETLLTMPETLVERNIPVDVAKEELVTLADAREKISRFSRDNYLSYLEMREINQAGMQLRGIFSNAMKGYQVMVTAMKAKGLDPDKYGLITDPIVGHRMGALVNAAVDNAKDQLLGNLGIGTHNANMVAYLVITGRSFEQIVKVLDDNKADMDKIRHFNRYDVKAPFRASEEWKDNIPLASLYYLGNESSRIAGLLLNRSIPSSDAEMIKYRKDFEAFINGQYKAFGKRENFNLVSFLSNPEDRAYHIGEYGKLKGVKADGITRSQFNILQIYNDAPHINAYMNIYLLAHNLASNSKAFKVTSNLIDNVLKTSKAVDERSLRTIGEMKDFTYGLFIDQFLQHSSQPEGFDLSTPEGREDFVNKIGTEDYKNYLSAKYPSNSFVKNLQVTSDKKRNWKDSTLLRVQDLRQTSEEAIMQMQFDFSQMQNKDKSTLVMYNLVTRQGKYAKDSFASILSPADKGEFNTFLDRTLNIDSFVPGRMRDMFERFRKGSQVTLHNAVPYTLSSPKRIEIAEQAAPQAVLPPTEIEHNSLDGDTINQLNSISKQGAERNITSLTPLPAVSEHISRLIALGTTSQMQIAYLKGLKQNIENRVKASNKEVEERVENCAPKNK